MIRNAVLQSLRRSGPHLVLGRAGLDFYAEPPGASVEEAETFRAALGGSSANIAVAIVKNGGRAHLVTRVAADPIGRRCVRELQSYGVNTDHVRPEGGDARNSLAVITSRVRDFQSTIYRNGAADFAMNEADVAGLPYEGAASLILTGTVLAAEPSRSAAFTAIERARNAGVPVVFDVDYRPYSWPSSAFARDVLWRAVEASSLVVGNDEEWDWLAGGEPTYQSETQRDFSAAVERAKTAARDRIVIFKRGPAGSTTFGHDEGTGEMVGFETPAFAVEAMKPVGAGDAFLGTLYAAIALGADLEDAVQRGAAAAAITVTRFGCAPAIPTPDEIDALRDR